MKLYLREMKALLILLPALCLAAAMQAAASPDGMKDVGGDFGREWLEGRTAGGPEPAEEDDLFSWAEGPKGNPSASQYAANEPIRNGLRQRHFPPEGSSFEPISMLRAGPTLE